MVFFYVSYKLMLLSDMTQSTLQFDHQGAFIKVEHAVADLLQVELQFKTLKPDTILLYTETTSDTDQETGYIQVRYVRRCSEGCRVSIC